MSFFKKLWKPSLASEYQVAKEQHTLDVVARLSRGNVIAQNGGIMGGDELRRRSAKADESIALLKKLKSRG